MKELIKKIIPKKFLSFYHFLLSYFSAFYYGYPSRKMIVVGITGTKGKSTTCFLLGRILEEAGYRVGITSTAIFKIGKREWLNSTKMTMLGRFALQKILKQMVIAECEYAVIETSSEGIAQARHRRIDYDVALFTNLSPEHIEAHGNFEKYRQAKGKLFQSIKYKVSGIKYIGEKPIPKVSIVNLDDPNAEYFLKFRADEHIGFTLQAKHALGLTRIIQASNVELNQEGSRFFLDGAEFRLKLLGEMNVYNALAAVSAAVSQNVPLQVASAALSKISVVPGRLELIDEGQSFRVIIDYAHEPRSFQELYATLSLLPHKRLIHVFGATGGGRDKNKRAEMGRIAGEKADIVIVTTDDPYDEDPAQILRQVKSGITNSHFPISNIFEILDRREAIKKAIELAQPNDIVLITGKGCEQTMVLNEKKIPWDDREIARKYLKALLGKVE